MNDDEVIDIDLELIAWGLRYDAIADRIETVSRNPVEWVDAFEAMSVNKEVFSVYRQAKQRQVFSGMLAAQLVMIDDVSSFPN